VSEQDSSLADWSDCGSQRDPSDDRDFRGPRAVQRRVCILTIGSYRVHQVPRIRKLLATFQAHLVRPFPDGEHVAQSAVMASAGELENPEQ